MLLKGKENSSQSSEVWFLSFGILKRMHYSKGYNFVTGITSTNGRKMRKQKREIIRPEVIKAMISQSSNEEMDFCAWV